MKLGRDKQQRINERKQENEKLSTPSTFSLILPKAIRKWRKKSRVSDERILRGEI